MGLGFGVGGFFLFVLFFLSRILEKVLASFFGHWVKKVLKLGNVVLLWDIKPWNNHVLSKQNNLVPFPPLSMLCTLEGLQLQSLCIALQLKLISSWYKRSLNYSYQFDDSASQGWPEAGEWTQVIRRAPEEQRKGIPDASASKPASLGLKCLYANSGSMENKRGVRNVCLPAGLWSYWDHKMWRDDS